MRKPTTWVAPLLLLAALTAAAARDRNPPSIVTPATVRLIESRIEMPRGAEALANYDRYYLLRNILGAEIVHGRFVLRSLGTQRPESAEPVPDVTGAFTVPRGGQLPQVAEESGCAVVTIYFNVGSKRLVRIEIEGNDEESGSAVCGQPPL